MHTHVYHIFVTGQDDLEVILSKICIDRTIIFRLDDADRSYNQFIEERVLMPEIASVITQFIRENFIAGRIDVNIDPDQSLIESGIMDSTGVLELVEFLESTYSIKVEDDELVPENLETVNNIIKFLQAKGVS